MATARRHSQKQPTAKAKAKLEAKRRAAAEKREALYQERLRTRDQRLRSTGRPLRDFFRPLGVEVDLVVRRDRDEWVVGGYPIIGWQGFKPGTPNKTIDKFVAQHFGKLFLDSLTTNAAEVWPGAHARYLSEDHGFVLNWPGSTVGFVVITPTRARILRGGPTVGQNYLRPGPHWAELRQQIEDHEAGLAVASADTGVRTRLRGTSIRQTRVPLRVLKAIPDGASRASVRTLMDASARLRLERQMVYGAPVVLESDFGRTRFEPIEGPANDLLVPFELSCDEGSVHGGIALSGDRDPLHVQLFHDDLNDDMFVWSTALSGYADLTTWDVLSAARSTGHSGRRRPERRERTSRDVSHRPNEPSHRRLPDHSRTHEHGFPSHLKPLGDTARHLGEFVAGHRRLLAAGWTPSSDAIERAKQVGIKLGPRETWVRPHVRGVPDGFELRFAWRPESAGSAPS